MHGKLQWSLRPRTYAILRLIGCEEALDDFVSHNLSDFGLPYTATNLPDAVKGAKARQDFLNLQNMVLNPQAVDLEDDGGPHKNFLHSANEYYIVKRKLGHGGFGEVDHVISRLSLTESARKRIPRGRTFKQDRASLRSFANELKNLKLLSHHHLVKLVGSYTDEDWVGLIMRPVADTDLESYLRSNPNNMEARKSCLRKFFGCLAAAVNYLHERKVRHKDIKPKNVLVKAGEVLLTDFGTSHNWSDNANSTTEGTVRALTRRYCAPEVAESAVSD